MTWLSDILNPPGLDLPWDGNWWDPLGITPNLAIPGITIPLDPTKWTAKELADKLKVNAFDYLLKRIYDDKFIAVDSHVYNLAGDWEKRPIYIRPVVYGSLLTPVADSFGGSITKHYLTGPGMRVRKYGKWVRNTYKNSAGEVQPSFTDLIGWQASNFQVSPFLDSSEVLPFVPAPAGKTPVILGVDIGYPDIVYWVYSWLFANHPEITDYNGMVVSQANASDLNFTITLGSGQVLYMPVPSVNYSSRYLYVLYQTKDSSVVGSNVVGPNIPVSGSWPSTDGWTQVSSGTNLTVWTKYETVDASLTYTVTRKYLMYFVDVPGTPTTHYYHVDYQDTTDYIPSMSQVMIYQHGSGNPTLDALMTEGDSFTGIIPPIPIRLGGKFVSKDDFPEIYTAGKKALPRICPTADLDKIIEQAATGNLDYVVNAYVQFGVTLNTHHDDGKRYIYEFFQELGLNAQGSSTGFEEFAAIWAAQRELRRRAVEEKNSSIMSELGVWPTPPENAITWGTGNKPELGFNQGLQWNWISESTGLGQFNSTATKGDFLFEVVGTTTYVTNDVVMGSSYDNGTDTYEYHPVYRGYDTDAGEGPTTYVVEHVRLYWQTSDTDYRVLNFYGMQFVQNVYNNQCIGRLMSTALAETGESIFIIPLHEGVLRKISLVSSTQITFESAFLIFNSFQQTNIPWYATEDFKIALIVVIVIVSIFTAGGASAAASGSGIFGSNVAVGTALGASASTAAVVGAIVNAMAAIALVYAITTVATELWGEEVGAWVGLAASVIVGAYASSGAGTSFNSAQVMGSLMRADNLLALTNAVANGYAESLRKATEELMAESDALTADYGVKMTQLADLYEKYVGSSKPDIDPLTFVNSTNYHSSESPRDFINRTLMTGSDIAEMTSAMISLFPKMTTSTELS